MALSRITACWALSLTIIANQFHSCRFDDALARCAEHVLTLSLGPLLLGLSLSCCSWSHVV
jgi:hypothetical protein